MATVSVAPPGAGTPTGTVTFKDGLTTIGQGTLSTSNGVTTAGVTGPATVRADAIDHRVVRRRHGRSGQQLDAAERDGRAGNHDHDGVGLAHRFGLRRGGNPHRDGERRIPAQGTPTGTVAFTDGSTSLGIGTLSTSNGVTSASLTVPLPFVGVQSITAAYGGDTDDQGSSSTPLSVSVGGSSTTTILSASPVGSVYGQAVALTATVSVASPGVGTPTGTVTFTDGATSLGTGTLSTSNGVTTASLTVTLPVLGTQSIKAAYGGDTDDQGSNSTPLGVTVGQDSTNTTVSASPVGSVYGQAVDLTATVSVASPGVGTPTGTVTFTDGATSLGTGTLSTSNGVTTASLTVPLPALGSQSITAAYGGDTDDQGSNSTPLSVTVGQDSTITSVSASPLYSVYGQSVTLTAAVTVAAQASARPRAGSRSPTGRPRSGQARSARPTA